MGKLSREEEARRQGMWRAYEIAKQGGIEALEEDLKMRGIFNLPIKLNRSDLFKADESLTQFILLEVLITLRDEFDFGAKRALRFKNRFEQKCQLIVEDWTNWVEQAEIVYEEMGIEFPEEVQKRFEKLSGETRE